MLTLVRNRDLVLLWVGQSISSFGDVLLLFALPYFVLELTGSIVATGGMLAAAAVPRVVMGPFAGLIADRYPHRSVLIVAELVCAAALLPLAVPTLRANVALIYVVVFASSSAAQVFAPTKMAFVPRLVPATHLMRANALTSSGDAVTRLAAPAIGGVLFAAFGLTTVVLIDVATFLCAAALTSAISTRSGPTRPDRSVRHRLTEALDSVRRHQIAPTLLLVAAILGIGSGGLNVLVVPYVRDVLHRGPAAFGALASAQGLGAICGSLAVGAWGRSADTRRLIISACAGMAISTFVLASTQSYAVAGAALLLSGAPNAAGLIAAQTLLQATVNVAHLGRVSGAFAMTINVATIAGVTTGASLAQRLGVVGTMRSAALVYACAAGVAYVRLRPAAVRNDRDDREPRNGRSTDLFDRLSDVPPFNGCGRAEVERLRRAGDVVFLPAGRSMPNEDLERWLYFVLDGTLVTETPVGRERLGSGAIVGVGRSSTRESFPYATAVTPTTLFVLDRRRLDTLIRTCPRFASALVRRLVSAPRSAQGSRVNEPRPHARERPRPRSPRGRRPPHLP